MSALAGVLLGWLALNALFVALAVAAAWLRGDLP